MQQLCAYKPPGASMTLVQASDIESSCVAAPQVLGAASARLRGTVQPLSAVLAIAAYPDGFPHVDDAVDLDGGVIQWRVKPWPSTVEPPPVMGGASAQQIAVEASRLPPVATLLEERGQLVAPSGYTATVSSFTTHCTSVRVEPRDFGSSQRLTVVCHGEPRGVPVEDTADGNWVAGPIVDTDGVAPVAFDFLNLGFEFRLSISVGWSLWKVSPGFRRSFRTIVAELVASGWLVTNSDDFDDLR